MKVDCIPFRNTGYFSSLICDYLEENKNLRSFYNRYPTLPNFKEQIQEKKSNFPKENRAVLAKALQDQYTAIDISAATQENINALKGETTHYTNGSNPCFGQYDLILPNLCYIGGGGELAYWLELKSYFTKLKVTFPMLLLRNSALLITKKQAEKVEKLNLSLEDLFMEQTQLINKKIRQISNIDIDFSPQKQLLDEQFKQLYKTAQQTDASFLGAVKAQEAKQKKGLEKLEKRLLKAQKRKLKDQVVRLTTIQNELFPNCSLQERHLNFSESYLAQGDELLSILFDSLDPLRQDYLVLYY